VRRLFVLAAALAALMGCGSDAVKVPQGNPAIRHGEEAIADYMAVEEIRVELTAASDLYYAGGSQRAARNLIQSAHDRYASIARRIRARDHALDREIEAAFERAARVLRRGATPDGARDTITPLADQLMDGAVQALVDREARQDSGLQAVVMTKLLDRLSQLSRAGLPQLFAQQWGYLRRAQALHVALADELGPQKDEITKNFGKLRDRSFPEGALPPENPDPVLVEDAVRKIEDAVRKRFELGSAL
jgi:hypothetical protein